MASVIPYVSRLFIYPIKSLDRVGIEKTTILRSGALKRDREFALFEKSGHFVNGKRCDRIHNIRSEFNLATNLRDRDLTTFIAWQLTRDCLLPKKTKQFSLVMRSECNH